ncbi:DMT family transporter [Noviherbaspirillum sp.]|uniref:DMT family transporter n=1 Tax=Noviherbaspirillum sp. TaxID=1926288 RepID=UPI002FE01E12
MRSADLFRLILLAAIWGASFLFLRIVAPALGPLWTAESRVAIAGAAMLLFILAGGRSMHFGTSWRQYLILGTLNSALPFALFSYAALTLPAGYSAILNATSPLWGALVGAAVLGETLTARKITGLLIGIAGVAFLVRLGPAQFSPQVMVAAAACVLAALCYGIAGAYSKKASSGIAPPQMATGSQLGAALVLLPFLPLSPIRGEVTPMVIMIALVLALLCSAVAYFIYFRLIADLGPTKALTVTFLIPLFALIWGALFLGEAVTLNMLIGCAMVVLATWLVVFQPATAPKAVA